VDNCPPEADLPWADTSMYYYVYVLKNKRGELYKGLTQNPETRVQDHNEGKVRSTKNGRPWSLVYFEGFVSKKSARKEELFLKSGKGRERLKYLLNE